jgi:hypothetical protein
VPIDDERCGFHRDDDVETLGGPMTRLHVEAPDKARGRRVGERTRRTCKMVWTTLADGFGVSKRSLGC